MKPSYLVRALTLGAVATAASLRPAPALADAAPLPVLMVIANQDFLLAEYRGLRAVLESHGRTVRVTSGSGDDAIAWGGEGTVRPDLALSEVNAADYSAIVFVGGWGSSMYQYAFEGTYTNAAYRKDRAVAESVNRLINDFIAQDKYVSALGHGVTVLAYARVNGVSPLKKRTVAAWAGGSPGFKLGGKVYADASVATRWHLERNGASMPLSSAIGDPMTAADDVWVDGKIITAENFDSVDPLGRLLVGTESGIW